MDKNNQYKRSNKSSLLGLIIILFGALLLIDNVFPSLYFFSRLFSWPVILIVCGLLIGSKSNYSNASSYILIIIGVFFFILRLFEINFSILFWPSILIALGFVLISNSKTRGNFFNKQPNADIEPIWDKRVQDETTEKGGSAAYEPSSNDYGDDTGSFSSEEEHSTNQNHSKDEYIDSTSVFSSNKINIVSQNFRGGNIVNIFAGTEVSLIHADIKGPVVLEVVQLFGGSTIIAPSHWVIQPEMAAIFGGIEDKRFTHTLPDSTKILYIRGTSLFGGITIKSV